MVCNTQDYWVFGLCPSSGILRNLRTQRFGNWICFHLQVRGRHLLCWVLYKELTSNRSSIRNVVFSTFLECRTVDKVQKTGISELKTCLETMISMQSVSSLYNESLWASACETEFSAPSVNFQVAHRSASCTWLSKFRIFIYT
jgi:hypothetical protein